MIQQSVRGLDDLSHYPGIVLGQSYLHLGQVKLSSLSEVNEAARSCHDDMWQAQDLRHLTTSSSAAIQAPR